MYNIKHCFGLIALANEVHIADSTLPQFNKGMQRITAGIEHTVKVK
jgi:hypothetical protein